MSQSPKLMQPTKYDFWFLPLGGTGEIGMNMNLYGHDSQWLMVDCGMGFEHTETRERRVCVDPSFIEAQRENLQAIVITHAHEDHIGALLSLWPRLQAPIYATSFAAAVILNKLSQVTWGHRVPVIEVKMQNPMFMGEFEVTWLPMPHSIPEATSVLIETPAGKVLHTGDWKMDHNPVVGAAFDSEVYQHLKSFHIDAMVCDATNAIKPGKTLSESACYQGLYQTISAAKNRVVVSCFSSNIARLLTLARIAKKTGRQMAVFGRSMENMVSIARRLGYWPRELELIDPKHIGYLPPEEVLVVATGSQAEPRAALTKMAQGRHYWLYLEPEDTVIFSAMKIPPNKTKIDQLIKKLRALDLTVIHADEVKDKVLLHASGHPSEDDVKQLLEWVQPKTLIPTHGEPEHLKALAKLAKKTDIQEVCEGRNGDLFKVSPFVKVERNTVPIEIIEVLES